MSKDRLAVNLGGIRLKNPIIPAAGCFGFGVEFKDIFDINRLGAITVKAVTREARLGNPSPRIVETDSGMLNSIGMQNDGVEEVIRLIEGLGGDKLPVIVNLAGDSVEDYVYLARRFSSLKNVTILELNISCPNVRCGGIAFGRDPKMASEITKEVKAVTDKLVYVKLSPNVSDIVEIAKAVEIAGADGITMINSVSGMSLNYEDGKPIFKNGSGGLSGPAIKPIAINMIYQVSQAVDIPIIGVGGISKTRDVIDFISAGASAVAIGVANFTDPLICIKIIDGLEAELDSLNVENISDLRGRSWKKDPLRGN